MIIGSQLIAPTTAGTGTSSVIEVDSKSVVLYIAPNAGETLTEDDSFELRRVVDTDPTRSIAVVDKDGPVLLGANRTQGEILIRGTYLIKKILVTTESVGVYFHLGIDYDFE